MRCNIYKLRIERGFSGVRKLAKVCGLSHCEISRLENNLVKNPSIVTCHKIASALNVTIDQLFTFDEGEEKDMIVRLLNYKKNRTPLTDMDFSSCYSKLNYHEKLCLSEIMLEYLETRDLEKFLKSLKEPI